MGQEESAELEETSVTQVCVPDGEVAGHAMASRVAAS
jgi:hypothetical protein